MSISERSPARKRPARWFRPSETMWLAMIAVLILVVQILAGTLLRPASPSGPSAPLENATASSTD